MSEGRSHSLVPSEYVAPSQDLLDLCKGTRRGPTEPGGKLYAAPS